MKRTLLVTIGLLALLLHPATVLAQPGGNVAPAGFLSNTTLNGAIDATQTTLVLTSASASTGSTFGAPAAGQCLYIDLELMRIVSMSSTTATVRRGDQHRSTHANAARILTGPCNGMNGGFMAADPPNIGGNQTCSNFTLPWINAGTGDSWWCDLQTNGQGTAPTQGGLWTVTNPVARNGTAGSRRVAQ